MLSPACAPRTVAESAAGGEEYVRILIADDDAVSRRLLQNTLTKRGYDITVASDGKEALEALRSDDAPSMAVLDWMMPELDGIEVCRKIREVKGNIPMY